GARLDADSVQGKVGGDLGVESRKDVEKDVKVDVDAGLSHSNDPAGRQGQLKVNVDVVNNDAVGQQSAIAGNNGVVIQNDGQTQLTGGEIRSQQGKVDLGGGKVSQQDISGQRYQSGVRVDVATTVDGLLDGGMKQSLEGKVPFASGHTSSKQVETKAGMFNNQ
ncbi:filamentous hemagglutinin, partial [Salmonella enterica]|nr:filamentous hemagglutinin [Salmonella enterica]